MNEHLRRAMAALEAGARELRGSSARSAGEVRGRLRRTVDEVLTHLEEDERVRDVEPEDIVSRLDRQSRDIADDLRRVEQLMKHRTGQDPDRH